MYSILDIDLDYFEAVPRPVGALGDLLTWAASPVSVLVERHHQAFAQWRRVLRTLRSEPSHILHVDQHHDMMDERRQANIANFMYHAMQSWPGCRVHWLVDHPIDWPSMWLDPQVWHSLSRRFTAGANRPASWPRPDLVSVCTSPEFTDANQSPLCQDE